MADSVKIKIDGDDSGFQKSWSNITGSVKKGAGIAVKGIAGIGAAFTGATALALNFAGELEQNLGGSEAVFKEYAGSIQATADEAFKNMGLSASDFLANANKMGALFQGAGFSIEESADLSSKAMQRASDVASIMGIDVSMAMESIAGAAKGNFTMMDNLGVAMNATTIEAYALSKGITTSYAAMSNQQKIGLAMEMFLEKTAYAAGNYAKENETLAGALTTAKAALKNFMSGAGDVDDVVDALSNAAKVILKNIKDLLPALVEGLEGIVTQLVPMIPDILRELIPAVLSVVDELIDALIEVAPQIVAALADGIGAAVPVLQPVTDAIKALMDNFNKLIPVIAGVVAAVVTFKAAMMIEAVVSSVVASIKAFKKANDAATVSQALFNATANANPYVLIATAIVGVIAALGAFISQATKADAKTAKLQKKNEELKTSFEEVQKACDETAAKQLDEIEYVEGLTKELDRLVGANYEVKETDKARVDFILGELKNALGEEYDSLQEIIDQNGNVAQSVYDAIDAEKARILIEANKDAYTEALTKESEAANQVGEAYLNLLQKREALKQETGGLFTSENDIGFSKYAEEHPFSSVVTDLEAASKAYKEATQQQEIYAQKVINYNDAITAAAEGDTKKVQQLLSVQDKYIVTSVETHEEAQRKKSEALALALANYENAIDNFRKNNNEATKKNLESARDIALQAAQDAREYGVQFSDGVVEIVDGSSVDIQNSASKAFAIVNAEATGTMQELLDKLPSWIRNNAFNIEMSDISMLEAFFTNDAKKGFLALSNTSPQYHVSGQDIVNGAIEGINSKTGDYEQANINLANAGKIAFDGANGIESPAKEYIKSSEYIVEGAVKGITDNKGLFFAEMYNLGKDGVSEYKKATDEIYKKASQSDFKRKLSFAKSAEEINEIKATEVDGLLDKEKEYLAEKACIELERDEQEYQERLKNAKDAEAREKIKQERIKEIAEKEQDAYLEQLKEAADAQSEIYKALQKDFENFLEKAEDAADDAKDKMEDLLDARDDLANRFKDELVLYTEFTVPNINGEGTVTGIKFADMKKQSEDLKAYAESLNKLKGKADIPQEFFAHLRDMDTAEGKKVTDALLAMSDEDLKEYLDGWQEYQDTAEDVSNSLLSDEFEELANEIAQKFGQVPEEFFDIGKNSAKEYGEGFMRQLETEMQGIREKVAAEWNSMSSGFVISVAGAGGGTTINNNTNVTVNSNGGGSQTDEIRAWNDAMTVERMRN